jgi:2-iminobutanoate/2-iminopropanoate deaminase
MTMRKIIALSGLIALAVFAAAAQKGDVGKKQIQTDKAPKAGGPLSQGIAAGGFVFSSGQLPVDPATGKIVPGGIEDQTRQVLKNLSAVLEAGGSSLDHVVKCTVILKRNNRDTSYARAPRIFCPALGSPSWRAEFPARKSDD